MSFGVPAVTGEGTVPAASPDGMLGQGVSEKQLQIRAHSELMHIRKSLRLWAWPFYIFVSATVSARCAPDLYVHTEISFSLSN